MSSTLPCKAKAPKEVLLLAGNVHSFAVCATQHPCWYTLLVLYWTYQAANSNSHSLTLCSITEANKYTQQELRFMKTQDAGYLAMKAQTELKVHTMPHNHLAFTHGKAYCSPLPSNNCLSSQHNIALHCNTEPGFDHGSVHSLAVAF